MPLNSRIARGHPHVCVLVEKHAPPDSSRDYDSIVREVPEFEVCALFLPFLFLLFTLARRLLVSSVALSTVRFPFH